MKREYLDSDINEKVTSNLNINDGTVNFNGYVFWTKTELVKPYVKCYLAERFPNNLIIHELNKIDLVVLGENLPVEIQSTLVGKSSKYPNMMNSHFEDKIRRQIEDNIENYDRCWFFFDFEYHRYLSNSATLQISMNLDWFAKYVKESKLKVFTVKYDGGIKELEYNDLEFVRKLSSTCKMDYESDVRILNRNKIKIMNNVLEGYKFTQEEIDRFLDDFNNRKDKSDIHFGNFLRREGNQRKKLYSNILMSIGNLGTINYVLDMNSDYDLHGKNAAKFLGIFKTHGNCDRTEFHDYFDICKYFPGYNRNKETWNRIKDSSYSDRQLRNVFFVYHDKSQLKLDF